MIKPLNKRVLVEVDKPEEKTTTGIIIPVISQKNQEFGKVIATATDTTSINVGDKVLFDKYSATQVKYKGEDYLILPSEGILAIVE